MGKKFILNEALDITTVNGAIALRGRIIDVLGAADRLRRAAEKAPTPELKDKMLQKAEELEALAKDTSVTVDVDSIGKGNTDNNSNNSTSDSSDRADDDSQKDGESQDSSNTQGAQNGSQDGSNSLGGDNGEQDGTNDADDGSQGNTQGNSSDNVQGSSKDGKSQDSSNAQGAQNGSQDGSDSLDGSTKAQNSRDGTNDTNKDSQGNTQGNSSDNIQGSSKGDRSKDNIGKEQNSDDGSSGSSAKDSQDDQGAQNKRSGQKSSENQGAYGDSDRKLSDLMDKLDSITKSTTSQSSQNNRNSSSQDNNSSDNNDTNSVSNTNDGKGSKSKNNPDPNKSNPKGEQDDDTDEGSDGEEKYNYDIDNIKKGHSPKELKPQAKNPFDTETYKPRQPKEQQDGMPPPEKEPSIEDIIKMLKGTEGSQRKGVIKGLTALINNKQSLNESTEGNRRSLVTMSVDEYTDYMDDVYDLLSKVDKKTQRTPTDIELSTELLDDTDLLSELERGKKWEKLKAEKDAAQHVMDMESLRYLNVPTIKDMELDIENALKNQVAVYKGKLRTYREIDSTKGAYDVENNDNGDSDDESDSLLTDRAIRKVKGNMYIQNPQKPKVRAYLDASGSWGSAADTFVRKSIRNTLKTFADEGTVRIAVKYFGDTLTDSPSTCGGGTSAWPHIIKDIVASETDNVILVTDDDMFNSYSEHVDTSIKVELSGNLWVMWNGDACLDKRRSLLLNRFIVSGDVFEYAYDGSTVDASKLAAMIKALGNDNSAVDTYDDDD